MPQRFSAVLVVLVVGISLTARHTLAQDCGAMAGEGIAPADLHLALGLQALDRSDFAMAAEEFERAAALGGPRRAIAEHNRIIALLAANDLDTVATELRVHRGRFGRDQLAVLDARLRALRAGAPVDRRLAQEWLSVEQILWTTLARADQALAGGDPDTAIRELRRAQCIRPRGETLLRLARAHESAGDYESARTIISALLLRPWSSAQHEGLRAVLDRIDARRPITADAMCRAGVLDRVRTLTTPTDRAAAGDAFRRAYCLTGEADHAFDAAVAWELAGTAARAMEMYRAAGDPEALRRAECLEGATGCPAPALRASCARSPHRDVGREIAAAIAAATADPSTASTRASSLRHALDSAPLVTATCADVRTALEPLVAGIESGAWLTSVFETSSLRLCEQGEFASGGACCRVGTFYSEERSSCTPLRSCGSGMESDGIGGCRCMLGRVAGAVDACCWPGQGWDGAACRGPLGCDRLPGFVAVGDRCVPEVGEAIVERARCDGGDARSCGLLAQRYLRGGDGEGVLADLDQAAVLAARGCAGGSGLACLVEGRVALNARSARPDREATDRTVLRALERARELQELDASYELAQAAVQGVGGRGRDPLPHFRDYCVRVAALPTASPSALRDCAHALQYAASTIGRAGAPDRTFEELRTAGRALCLAERTTRESLDAQYSLCFHSRVLGAAALDGCAGGHARDDAAVAECESQRSLLVQQTRNALRLLAEMPQPLGERHLGQRATLTRELEALEAARAPGTARRARRTGRRVLH